jgi:hypothetical protein
MVCYVLLGHECDPNERTLHHHSQLHLQPLFFWSVLFWNLCIGEYHLCKESDKFLLFESIADQEKLVGWCRGQGYKGKVQAIQVETLNPKPGHV